MEMLLKSYLKCEIWSYGYEHAIMKNNNTIITINGKQKKPRNVYFYDTFPTNQIQQQFTSKLFIQKRHTSYINTDKRFYELNV